MSFNGISQTYQPLSLNGINTGNFNNIYINGVLFDPTAVVPYTGATKTVDLGSNELKTSYVPTTGPDVINKTYSDANLVPYTGASSDVNLNGHALTTGNLSNPTNTSNSLASLITTGTILPLSGFSPSTVVVGNAFGPITNGGGIYQSTSIITSYLPSLNLGLLTAGAKYSITMSLKLVDTVNSNYLQLYASSNGNYTLGGITLSLQASFPPNTTTYQTLTGIFTMPVGYPYLILLLNSGSSGTETVYWQTYSLLGMGSSIVSLVNPTNANDAVNKTYVDTATALLVPYTGATSDTTLGTYKMSSSSAPTTGNNFTNKTYVDTATALLVPYTGATADLQLASRNFTQTTGTVTTNGISQLNATASTVPIYDASKSLISSSIPSSYITGFTSDPQTQLNGKGGLASNNTWTGTNTFNNNLTLGDGYNAILAEIGYINQTYITSATPTTTGITAIAPTPTGTITFSTPTYTMTPSGASTFASFWSSATFTGTTRCFFNFTNMFLANAPSGATITVCQANTANSAYVNISSAIALPQSSPMFSGYFTPNSNASYVGQIFFILSNVKFNPFSWTAFTYGYGAWTVQGNETVNGTIQIINGVAPPATGSLGGSGDRLILFPGTSSVYPYSLGINAGTLWYSAPTSSTHNWYVGGVNNMTLNSGGTLVLTQPSGGYQLQLLNNSANAMFMNFNSNGGAGVAYIGMDNSGGTGLFGSGIPYSFDIGTSTATPICFFTSNVTTPRMTINSAGNVGIGTASPGYLLEVNGTIATKSDIRWSGSGLNAADKKLYSPADGDLEWMTNNAAGVHGFAVSNQGTKLVYLNSSGNSYFNGGNVGIGTATPTSTLQIVGTGGASSTATMTITNSSNSNTGYGAQLLFNNISSGSVVPLGQISALRENNAANYTSYMAFYTTDATNTMGERMRISSGGTVLIGSTSVPSYNPTFVVNNNGGFQETTQIYSNNATSYNMLRLSTNNYVSSGNIYLMGFYNAGTLMGSIVSNGATNTTLYGTTSDARAKKNIDYSFDGMAIINQLKPASFNMLSDETDTVIHGFIAQDVLPIYPQYVITTQEDTYQMDYTQFMGIAVKAIQELSKTITSLQSQLTAQAQQIAELTSLVNQLLKK